MTPDDDMSLRSILERHTLVAAQYRAALSRRLGLGATATAALLHFAHQSPLTLGQLGQMLVVSSRDASAAIEQLEERGWRAATMTGTAFVLMR
jgi:DNA-binding MarR family transcriptional regulator